MKFLELRSKHLFVVTCLALTVAAGGLQAQTKQTPAKTNTSAITGVGANSGTMTQNVNVVNTPTVNVGTLPAVSISGTPAVNVNSLPAVNVNSLPPVSLAGTPTVNTNVTFPANQAVTVAAAGPLTNVGRLPSQQVMLRRASGSTSCLTGWFSVALDGGLSCFDMANQAGQVLVVTDVHWQGFGNVGTFCPLSLVGTSANTFNFGPTFFMSATTVTASGFFFDNQHLTTGAKMTVNPAILTNGSSCTVLDSMLHGYLLPNQ